MRNLLHDETLLKIGKNHNKSAAQICIRWQVQRGLVVLPKSETPSRIRDNFDIWDFKLSDDEMKAIAALDTNKRSFKMDFGGTHLHPEFPFKDILNQ